VDFETWVEREWRPQIAAINNALFGSYDSPSIRQEATPGLIKEFHEHMAFERREHDAFRALRIAFLVLAPIVPGGVVLAKLLGAL